MQGFEAINFKKLEECCYINEDFDKCSRRSVKNSFFCGEHKPLLFKLNEFRINHGGNAKEIVETMIIKSAKDANLKGIGFNFKKKPFSQVFTQIFFPNFGIKSYNSGIKKKGAGEVFLKTSILNILSKKDINIHFSINAGLGGLCGETICIQYSKEFSIRENLNRFYHFLILSQYITAISNWKYSKDKKSIDDIRKEVFEDASNELVFSESIPLIIDGKNYMEEYILY
jgi:hypothetical protein